jgi:hypothetical protein
VFYHSNVISSLPLFGAPHLVDLDTTGARSLLDRDFQSDAGKHCEASYTTLLALQPHM